MVVNRTFERASEIAGALGGIAVPFDRLARTLPLADLVISAASGDGYLLHRAEVEEAMRERRRRSMLLIDLAVPRSFDPGINDLDGVYLYDIDDLDAVIADNREARAGEAQAAERIVDGEVDTFLRWLDGLDVVPTVVALREKLERLREAELARFFQQGGATLDARDRDAVERFVRTLVGKILHDPLTELRRRAAMGDDVGYAAAVRALFALEADPDGDSGDEEG
jgi:glutamyl-tRNA reductase